MVSTHFSWFFANILQQSASDGFRKLQLLKFTRSWNSNNNNNCNIRNHNEKFNFEQNQNQKEVLKRHQRVHFSYFMMLHHCLLVNCLEAILIGQKFTKILFVRPSVQQASIHVLHFIYMQTSICMYGWTCNLHARLIIQ